MAIAASALSVFCAAGSAYAAPPTDADLMVQYVHARLADAAGQPGKAAAYYSNLLNENSGDPVMAMRAYRGAIGAGDMVLALRAARMLDAAEALPPEGLILLFADSVRIRDRATASALLTRIEGQANFGFLAPILRAWTERDEGQSGAAAILDGPFHNALTTAYSGEHKMLILLSENRTAEALSAFRMQPEGGGLGGALIRVNVAAQFIALRQRDFAREVLAGSDPLLEPAANLVDHGKRLPVSAKGAANGVALLFGRLAIDINRQQPSVVALALAQAAAHISPGDDGIKLLIASIRAGNGNFDGALSLLETISPKGPWIAEARDAKVRVLADAGRKDEALKLVSGLTVSSAPRVQDYTRLGEIYMSMDRPADAALAYDKAIFLAEAKGTPNWALWLFKGSAQHQAGQWPAAREALAKAVELAPDQAVALNYLGYAQLERRENLEEAEQLILKASALRPEDSAITDSLGWTYFLRGKLPEAIATLERAARGEPGETTINEHLGDAYWTTGRRIDARYAWQAALIQAEGATAERIRAKVDFGLTPETIAP